MGYSIETLYIGPMVVLAPLELVEDDEKMACTNSDCPANGKAAKTEFCARCGKAVSKVFFTTRRMATLTDFLYDEEHDYEDFEDVLHCSEYDEDTLLPNHSNLGFYAHWGELSEAPVFLDNIQANVEKHIEAFKAHYKDILAALTEYGFDYTIKYGVKTY